MSTKTEAVDELMAAFETFKKANDERIKRDDAAMLAARPATAAPVGVDRDEIKAALQSSMGWPADLHPGPAADAVLAILASLRSPEPGGGREYVLLASYCGDDNPDCTDGRPCGECLAMCNVVGIDGRHIRELGAAPASPSEEG